MGNSLGGKKKTTKVMKINGETFKLKTPIKAGDVLKDHPGLVLLDSEAVKHYGLRAKALQPHKELQPKRLYFLVELPRENVVTRRVHSVGINMSAKDRLESLVLSRRSTSDLTVMKPIKEFEGSSMNGEGVRLKMRLPRGEVEKLMQSSKDEGEAAERIMRLCMENNDENKVGEMMMVKEDMHWKRKRGRIGHEFHKAHEKRVSFMPINEGGNNPVAVAS